MIVNKAGIYCIRFGDCDRIYIGSAMNMLKRKSQHLYKLRRNNHENPKLQNYYNKYKEELFSFQVLEIIDDCTETVRNKEQEYLNKYYAQEYINSNFQDKRFDILLLNVTPEVNLMRVHWTLERKEALKVRNKNFVWTKDLKQKMSNIKKGKIASIDQKQNQQNGINIYWEKIRKTKNIICKFCNNTHVRKCGIRLNKRKNILMQKFDCQSCNKKYSKQIVNAGPLDSDV